jgi:hypothetical protein
MRLLLAIIPACAAHLLESDEEWSHELAPGFVLMFFLLLLLGVGFCGMHYFVRTRHHNRYSYMPPNVESTSSSSDADVPPPMRDPTIYANLQQVHATHSAVTTRN